MGCTTVPDYSSFMVALRFPKPMHYKLDGHRSVPCENHLEWVRWHELVDRCVAETCIDDVRVSTVFLALDHNPFSGSDPALFETMVFVDGISHQMHHYFTWEAAEQGHAEMVGLVRAEMDEAQAKVAQAWAVVAARLFGAA